MNKSKIEYLTHTWPIITGCNQPASICACQDQCWARAWHRRFKERLTQHYNVDFSPHVNIDLLTEPLRLQRASRIGIGFTGDIGCINPHWTFMGAEGPVPFRQWLFTVILSCNHPRHQFVFLTKSPEKLVAWGQWPDNAWVGASATNATELAQHVSQLSVVKAKHRWLSVEPLISWAEDIPANGLAEMFCDAGISWVVIGGWSRYTKACPPPKLEWIADIELACDQAGVGIWEKSNLARVLNRPLRQEYP